MSINIQRDLPQIPPPWLASYIMGNYSEERATFSPVTLIQSLKISGRKNETGGRWEEEEEEEEGEGEGATKRRGDERVFLQEEEIYSVGFVQI